MFVWTDIETTGLDPDLNVILELGMIVTDDSFVEVAREEWTVGHIAERYLQQMSPFVYDMHRKSGLLDRIANPKLGRAYSVEQDICNWLSIHVGPCADIKLRPCMAGNSVHFDRKFLGAQMPSVLDYVNYRLLDVSTLKVLCMATIPGARTWEAARREPDHTPLKDLEASLLELAHWRKELSRS